LTDFGLARPEEDSEHLTSEGVVVGTPAYMAPEQAAGQYQSLGPWTDLYGLGVVLYQMLTGKLPFEGPPLQVLARIVQETPLPLRHWRPELSPDLEAVVSKALAKSPAERYQTAQQFAEALAGWSFAGAAPTPNGGGKLAETTPFTPGRGATLTATAPEMPTRQGSKRPEWLIVGCYSLVTILFALLLGFVVSLFLDSGGPPTKKAEGVRPVMKDKVEQAEVSGRVLYKGKPLPGGMLTFVVEDMGFSFNAVIDEKGNYSITAPVSDVKISVDNKMLAMQQPAPRQAARPVPEPVKGKYVPLPLKFAATDTSSLTYTVKKGKQTHDIELTD
jgi:hypothetical protein